MLLKPFDLFGVFSIKKVNGHLLFVLIVIDISLLGLQLAGPAGHEGIAIAIALVTEGFLAIRD